MVKNNTIWWKIVTSFADLIETTWLTIYYIPMDIIYDQGSEFIGY